MWVLSLIQIFPRFGTHTTFNWKSLLIAFLFMVVWVCVFFSYLLKTINFFSLFLYYMRSI